MRPTDLKSLKEYIRPGVRMRMIPANGEPQELVVEKKSHMAAIFRGTEANPNGRAMLWPTGTAVRYDEAGFDKLDSKGGVLVRYEWLDPEEEIADEPVS